MPGPGWLQRAWPKNIVLALLVIVFMSVAIRWLSRRLRPFFVAFLRTGTSLRVGAMAHHWADGAPLMRCSYSLLSDSEEGCGKLFPRYDMVMTGPGWAMCGWCSGDFYTAEEAAAKRQAAARNKTGSKMKEKAKPKVKTKANPKNTLNVKKKSQAKATSKIRAKAKATPKTRAKPTAR